MFITLIEHLNKKKKKKCGKSYQNEAFVNPNKRLKVENIGKENKANRNPEKGMKPSFPRNQTIVIVNLAIVIKSIPFLKTFLRFS